MNYHIVAYCVDMGQEADRKTIKQHTLETGASACHIADVKKEYVEDLVWPVHQGGAVYEDKYLLGTFTARPQIAKFLVEWAALCQDSCHPYLNQSVKYCYNNRIDEQKEKK